MQFCYKSGFSTKIFLPEKYMISNEKLYYTKKHILFLSLFFRYFFRREVFISRNFINILSKKKLLMNLHFVLSASPFPRTEKRCRNMHLRAIIHSGALGIHFAKYPCDLSFRRGFWRIAKKKIRDWRDN